jgi:TPR repeat protein
MRKSIKVGLHFFAAILVLPLLLHAGATWAAPEDDYRSGAEAYRSGDVVTAMALLRKSADAGYAPSQSLLAYILDKSEFDEEAVAYYRKAAAQGDPDGEYGLGTMYALGEGVGRDPLEARKWISRAAGKGQAAAINSLAQAYIDGALGFDESQRNGAEALRWVRLAADSGYWPALERLAAAYRTGAYGLPIDLQQAERLEVQGRAARGVAEKRVARGKEKK